MVSFFGRDIGDRGRSARKESPMTNPYIAPSHIEVARDNPIGNRPRLLALLAALSFGTFSVLALGMTTCWLRGGWLKQQLQLPIVHLRLPMYFWFHFGVWFVSALVLSILALPMYLYLRRSFNVFGLMCFVYAIGATATIVFEAFKSYEMIEPPTHALIVLLTSFALLLPLCLIRLLKPGTRSLLQT